MNTSLEFLQTTIAQELARRYDVLASENIELKKQIEKLTKENK